MKKTAVIHTTPVTIPTLKTLMEQAWGQGQEEKLEVVNLLDDSMLPEINREGRITEGVKYRLNSLLLLAQTTGADAVLCACSSIGGLAEAGREILNIPVFRIDEPMAAAAVGFNRVGVAATLQSTILPTTDLIRRKAQEAGRAESLTLNSLVIENVGALLAEGREAEYDRIVGEKLKELLSQNEVVVLAQASMARAVENWPEEEKKRCLTSPVSGTEEVCAWLRQR